MLHLKYPRCSTGEAQVIGPYNDKWGNWITPLAPVADYATGETIAVQGIDISAERFIDQIKRTQFQAILITWLFAIVSLIYYYFARRLRESLRCEAKRN